MDREEARRAEIMIAFANGSDVQFYNRDTKQWEDIRPECVLFEPAAEYRVKPEPKYRPFKTKEECWNEMHKHPDLGWVKRNVTGEYMQVIRIYGYKTGLIFNLSYNSPAYYSPQMMLSNYTFTDGTLFGIKEE